MFEDYSEKARRAVFFARYEASQFGSPYIETEHLLLGLLHEDTALAHRFFRADEVVESIRKQIEAHTTIREKVSASMDIPLGIEGRRILAYAAEEAEQLSQRPLGTGHLLLGLLREEGCFAAQVLQERGLRFSEIREELKQVPEDSQRAEQPITPQGKIGELQKRIDFIVRKIESATSNHELEKARFYSDEERKDRERLRLLRKEYNLDGTGTDS